MSVDLPEPETPVTHTNRLTGSARSIFFRLFPRAPRSLKTRVLSKRRRFLGTAISSAPERYCPVREDRKSTRLNSSHLVISYSAFCLKHNQTLRGFFNLRSNFTSHHTSCFLTTAGPLLHSAFPITTLQTTKRPDSS